MKKLNYINLPSHFAREMGNFRLDPSIPLPVEMDDNFNPEDFGIELILSGILNIMAYDRNHKNFAYYRDFALSSRPTLLAELSQAGIERAHVQDYILAEEIFLAMEGLEPGNSRTALNLALLYEKQAEAYAEKEDWDTALSMKKNAKAYYSLSKQSEPPLPEAYLNAGYFFMKEGSWDKAKENFETYLVIGVDEEKRDKARRALAEGAKQEKLDGLFKESYDAILLGNESTGIEKITEFLKHHPDIWNGWFILGWAHRRLGHWALGSEAFTKALELGGVLPDVLNELAVCSMELGDLKGSRKHLEKALAAEPENVKIMSNLGILSMKMGKNDEARGFFLTILEFEPEDPVALSYLEKLK